MAIQTKGMFNELEKGELSHTEALGRSRTLPRRGNTSVEIFKVYLPEQCLNVLCNQILILDSRL